MQPHAYQIECYRINHTYRYLSTYNFPLMSLTFIDSSWMSKSIRLTRYSRSYLSLSNLTIVLWYSWHRRRNSSESRPQLEPCKQYNGRKLICCVMLTFIHIICVPLFACPLSDEFSSLICFGLLLLFELFRCLSSEESLLFSFERINSSISAHTFAKRCLGTSCKTSIA